MLKIIIIETKPKQIQSWSSGFVFKHLSHEKLKFKKCPKFGYHEQR